MKQNDLCVCGHAFKWHRADECWVAYGKFWHGEVMRRPVRANQCTCRRFRLEPR